jgi:putative ABC transport system permease protein
MLGSLGADVRFALRWLRRSPGFALVAVVSLAIGIGFNTALFSLLDVFFFRPLPVAGVDRLADVFTSNSIGAPYSTTSYPDFLDLKADNGVFDDLIGYTPMFGALNLGDRSRLVTGELVTGDYFRTFGVHAAMGRTILPADDAPGAAPVAMVSYRYWTRELDGASGVIGQTLRIHQREYAIVGVAPKTFTGMVPLLDPEVWLPMTWAAEVEPVGLHDAQRAPPNSTRLTRRGDRWIFVRGHLKAGVTTAQAQANLRALMTRLASDYPIQDGGRTITVKATSQIRVHPDADARVEPVAIGLSLAVGLVLLIACANVAGLLVARTTDRQREIAVRTAIGASRSRLVRQLVTESLVLAAGGGVAGVALAWWMTRIAESISLPLPFPVIIDLPIDGRVLAFTAGATILAALLAGLLPAIRASRSSIASDLRGAGSARRNGWGPRDLLVAAQMTVTALLLVVSALLLRSLAASERADLGFEPDHLALISMDTRMVGYSRDQSERFFAQAVDRIRALPGVQAAGLTTRVPFSVNVNQWDIWIPGREGRPLGIEVTNVSPGYFDAMGIAIVDGRDFTEADDASAPRVAVISETMARRYWPNQEAVGQTFRAGAAQGPVYRIVGVATDYKVSTVAARPAPFIHLSRLQQPNSYNVIVARTGGDAGVLLTDMRRTLLDLEPDLVFVESQTMDGEVAATLFPMKAAARIVSVIGLVAMILAAVGLYGVLAYAVVRRTREIGVRLALGARPADVVRMVMRRGLALVGTGLAAGCLLAAVAARLLTSTLYGVSPADPLSWIGAAVVLMLVAVLANLIPALRAARVEPSRALRVE